MSVRIGGSEISIVNRVTCPACLDMDREASRVLEHDARRIYFTAIDTVLDAISVEGVPQGSLFEVNIHFASPLCEPCGTRMRALVEARRAKQAATLKGRR